MIYLLTTLLISSIGLNVYLHYELDVAEKEIAEWNKQWYREHYSDWDDYYDD